MKPLDELLATPRMFFAPLDDNNSVRGLHSMMEQIKEEKKSLKDFVIVEIGSFSGVSSDLLARYCRKLLCIDIWSLGSPGLSHEQLKIAREHFREVLDSHDNIISIEDYADEVAKLIDDNSIDMVYIDAVHDYEYVKNDIITWSPKIIKGGYITGHDIHMPGVKQAVEEFFGNNYIKYKDESWSHQKK